MRSNHQLRSQVRGCRPSDEAEGRPVNPTCTGYDYTWESALTRLLIAFTAFAWVVSNRELFENLWSRMQGGDMVASIEQLVFITIVNLLVYGNFLYQFTRLGYLERLRAHQPARAKNSMPSMIRSRHHSPFWFLRTRKRSRLSGALCCRGAAGLSQTSRGPAHR